MFPGYGNMDSYTQHLPHLRDHIPSPNHYHPNWEPTPLHMKMDSFNFPSPYGPWPYNNQVDHHSCCNHTYPPGYHSFRPPYFHYQYPPQMFSQCPYPPYPSAYPPYFIPPQFDHARFEHDKDKNHCCGCPNHISHRKEGSNVRIEEQNDTPTIDEGPKTMPKDNHNSLIQYPYNYYPMMWLPDNGSRDGKTEKMMESLPILNFKDNFKDNLKDLGKGQGKSTHQGDNKVLQLPYPIFWMPSNDKPEEPVKDKEIDSDTITKAVEDGPSKVKIVPFKLLDNENPSEKPGVVEKEAKTQHSMDQVVEKERKIKTIPVKHLDSSNGEKLSMLEKPKNVLKDSVADEKRHDVAMKKDIGKKQPSPPKTSKLPPVCLRVEPLPKKNGSNGKGRSQSPPNLKERVKIDDDNNGHVAIMKKDSDKTPIKDIKVMDVKYQPSREGGKKDRKDATDDVGVQVKGNVGDNKEEREDFYSSQEQKIEQNVEKVDTSENNEKPVRKNYSPEDAALLIQAAFRGFNVRRWNPLEKLQKIAKIRGKVVDVKNQIQNYEGSLELDVKQKVVLSETIMNLLLQLDAVQGLLPSLREVRKSVASDLVYLQDKLDQLYNQAKHEEGTQKKNENSSPNTAASDITSSSEQICLASGSLMKEKNLSEQLSPYLKEEDVFVQESGASSTAAISDKTECAIVKDEVQESVCPNHVIPITILNDEMVPSEETQKKNENGSSNNAASDITSSSEQICLAGGSPMKEMNFLEQPSPYVKEENVFVQESGALSSAAVSDKTECAIVEDEVQEPVCPNHIIPITIQNDEMVPSGNEYYQKSQHEDENDRQADNLSSAEGKASIDENSLSQDVVELSSENEVSDFILKQNENPLEEQISEEELVMVKPNEANKQSFVVDDLASKATLVSEEGINLELFGARVGKAIEEESNAVGDASVVYEEVKPDFNEGSRLEKCEAKEESEMNESTETKAEFWIESIATPIQIINSQQLAEVSFGIAEEESKLPLSVKEDTEMIESIQTGAELCVESVAPPVQNNNSQVSSETPAVETSFIASTVSTDQTGVDSLEVFKEKELVEDNENLRQILEKLLHAGEEQMKVIADLNERVRNLERKLSKRKKVKVNQKLNKSSHSVGGKGSALSYEQVASSAA